MTQCFVAPWTICETGSQSVPTYTQTELRVGLLRVSTRSLRFSWQSSSVQLLLVLFSPMPIILERLHVATVYFPRHRHSLEQVHQVALVVAQQPEGRSSLHLPMFASFLRAAKREHQTSLRTNCPKWLVLGAAGAQEQKCQAQVWTGHHRYPFRPMMSYVSVG